VKEYGGRSNEEIFSLLEQKLPELKCDGIEVKYSTEPFAIAVVTPIMRRTAELMNSQVLFVDSTASCDVTNTVLTFLLVETPSGGSPIGAMLTQSQSMFAYQTGFTLLKEVRSVILYKRCETYIWGRDPSTGRGAVGLWNRKAMQQICSFVCIFINTL